MSYMALYRKFRPQTFEQVKGQEHVVKTLKNQIKNARVGHAYLFTGTRGTGKTSVAKLFAKAINCLDPKDGDPCGCCENCLAAAQDSMIDIVEVDAASNTGVDDIRRIIEEIQYTPVKGKYKVYIIDEVHMLSGSAFNAFLKTLEEPPAYAVFILATTEPHKLPITILSRCQRYDFHRISNETIAGNLAYLCEEEHIEAEPKALSYIARIGDGSMRDSISLLDKCIAFNLGEKLTYENVIETLGVVDTLVFSNTLRAIYKGSAPDALKEIEAAVTEGKDLSQFVSDFIWYLRNVLLINISGEGAADMLGISSENMALLLEDAGTCAPETVMRYIRILSELINNIKFSPAKQVLTEVAFIKMARPEMETDTASLADRIRQLEAGGVRAAAPAEPAAKKAPSPEPAYYEDFAAYDAQPYYPAEAYYEQPISPMMSGGSDPAYDEPAVRSEPELPKKETVKVQEAEPVKKAEPVREAAYMPSLPGEVADSWQDIIAACDSRMLKVNLRKAEVGAESDETVIIYVQGAVALTAIKNNLPELEAGILQITGKKLSVIAKSDADKAHDRAAGLMQRSAAPSGASAARAANNGEQSRSQTIDAFPQDLLKNINFEIGTEER